MLIQLASSATQPKAHMSEESDGFVVFSKNNSGLMYRVVAWNLEEASDTSA